MERIEPGAFVEMGELLSANLSLTDEELKQKPKHHRVFSITEWFHGLAVYVAVLSCTQPSCMPDQMGYQPLSEFRNAFWLGYDR